MHESEFDQKAWEENIWEQVLEEFNMPRKSRIVRERGLLRRHSKMAKRFEQLKEEQSS